MDFKRVLFVSDFHCGHKTGLTPPAYHRRDSKDKLDQIAIELWNKFVEIIDSIRPFDLCVAVGDLIDGRENSSECREGNRQIQAEIAVDCLRFIDAKKYVVIRGTPYHVGKSEHFEKYIADKVNAISFGAHEYIDVNGLVFDCKHKVGMSAVPYNTMPLAKEKLWAKLWADKGQPDSTVIVRAHTHKFNYCGDFDWLGLTTPGLQGTSEYGVSQIIRTIDFGVVYFDVWSADKWDWKAKQLELELTKSAVVKL
jgi:hypothetical protein